MQGYHKYIYIYICIYTCVGLRGVLSTSDDDDDDDDDEVLDGIFAGINTDEDADKAVPPVTLVLLLELELLEPFPSNMNLLLLT